MRICNVAVTTLGCKVNQYESEAMAEILREDGYNIVGFDEPADAYVINTCSVTAESDRKCRKLIRRARSMNDSAVIAVTGCYAQVSTEQVKTLGGVDIIVGTRNRHRIAQYLKQYMDSGSMIVDVLDRKALLSDNGLEKLSVSGHREHTRAFVKVEDGCRHFCSYCVIPLARGPVRSRHPAEVRDEAIRLAQSGYKEIVVTGINLSAYGSDLKGATEGAMEGATEGTPEGGSAHAHDADLAGLLELLNDVPGIERIRIGSMEPDTVDADFVSRIMNLDKLCPHFHISLQSGCDSTLERMRRGYTTEEYRQKADLLRANISDCAISTDIMAGFPGETDEEFEKTCGFVEEMNFSRAHIFKYSPRPFTAAASMPGQVPAAEKERRSRKLIEISRRKSLEFNRQFGGRVLSVLAERLEPGQNDIMTGFSPSYVEVRFRGSADQAGKLVDVEITGASGDHLRGKIV